MSDVTIRFCPECGQPFTPGHGSEVCCSDACRKARIDRRRKARREAGANPIVSRKCVACGKDFTPSSRRRTLVCSPECRRKRVNWLKRAYRNRLGKRRATRVTLATLFAERKEKARRRAEFFAARDREFERAGLPIPKVEVHDGVRIERRGTVPAGCNAADFIGHYS